jgi:hypothetical protein
LASLDLRLVAANRDAWLAWPRKISSPTAAHIDLSQTTIGIAR